MTLFDELPGTLEFDLEVVFLRLGAQLDLFALAHGLLLALLLLLTEVVLMAPEIHQAAGRWIRVRADFYEIELLALCDLQRLSNIDDPDLFSLLVDQSNLPSLGAFDDSILGVLLGYAKASSTSTLTLLSANFSEAPGAAKSETPRLYRLGPCRWAQAPTRPPADRRLSAWE